MRDTDHSERSETKAKGRVRPAPVFVTTHWSVIVGARDKDSPDSAAALEKLCHAYWYPLYAYVRRQGHAPHDAQDLTLPHLALLKELADNLAAPPDDANDADDDETVPSRDLLDDFRKTRGIQTDAESPT